MDVIRTLRFWMSVTKLQQRRTRCESAGGRFISYTAAAAAAAARRQAGYLHRASCCLAVSTHRPIRRPDFRLTRLCWTCKYSQLMRISTQCAIKVYGEYTWAYNSSLPPPYSLCFHLCLQSVCLSINRITKNYWSNLYKIL